jgi:hypothetical protein
MRKFNSVPERKKAQELSDKEASLFPIVVTIVIIIGMIFLNACTTSKDCAAYDSKFNYSKARSYESK